jgi:hypothetical protein
MVSDSDYKTSTYAAFWHKNTLNRLVMGHSSRICYDN